MKHHFFKRFAYEFEVTRLLWYAAAGGSDYAEVSHVCSKITKENDEVWYQAWNQFAEQLVARASNFTSLINKGNAMLRASRYFQAAEFFLHPTDTRKLAAYQKSVSYFYQGLDELQIEYTIHPITYDNVTSRTVFFKPSNTSVKGTFFICGGFDALLEELYFTTAAAALEQGYQVVLFEGPGQSDLLRYHKLAFDADWKKICQSVVNKYSQKGLIVHPTIAVGLSLGGLLMARAVSQAPQLFDKIILHNYFPSLLDSFKHSMPRFLHRYVDQGFPKWLLPICELYIKKQHFLNWQVEHAKWTFGQKSLNNLLTTCNKFQEPEDISTDCLVFLASEENYYNYKLGKDFFERIKSPNKKLIFFEKKHFSSTLHCQNGAAYDSNEQIFEWLNEG